MKSPKLAFALSVSLVSAEPHTVFTAKAQETAPAVKAAIGYSALHIGATEFTTVTDFFVTDVEGHVEDHDGSLNGLRLSAEIGGLLHSTGENFQRSYAVKGFYSSYESSQNSSCAWNAGRDCVFVPLFDPDPTRADLSGGFFSEWKTKTKREAEHFGGALEMRLNRLDGSQDTKDWGSLKDATTPMASPFQWRAGLAARRLSQDTDLYSADFGPTEDPVTLKEKLSTDYYGGYIGFGVHRELGRGLWLNLSAEGGLYWADSAYRGHYSATDSLDLGPISQSLRLDSDSSAFIGGLNLTLEKDIAFGRLGIFGEAEWISHAPTADYNETDRATPASDPNRGGQSIFDLTGQRTSTALGSSSAFTYTIGAKLTVPLK
jgi:hypothetical protein